MLSNRFAMLSLSKMLKLFLTVLLGLCLSFLPAGTLNPTSAALAANSNVGVPEGVATFSENVFGEIDSYLGSIPKGYYTVMKADALKSLIQRESALLVDVREPAEYAGGHIAGAINIPLRTLTQNLDKIPENRPAVLYCGSGYRSAMGVMALQMLGYKNVRGFPPSVQGWKAAGEPLERGTA
jgi:rhodanese-related sulfurtransferase